MCPKIEVPQNRWFIMENLIRMDDLGVPLFLETPQPTFCFCSSHLWSVGQLRVHVEICVNPQISYVSQDHAIGVSTSRHSYFRSRYLYMYVDMERGYIIQTIYIYLLYIYMDTYIYIYCICTLIYHLNTLCPKGPEHPKTRKSRQLVSHFAKNPPRNRSLSSCKSIALLQFFLEF